MAEVKEKNTEAKEVKKDETKNNNVHDVVVKIEGEEWSKALDKAFQKKQKTVKVDGFRPGKVTRDVFEKRFGKEALFLDAADIVLQSAYVKAVEDSKFVPVVQPEVNLKSVTESGVEFSFKIITKPEVKVKKYKGLGIKPEEVKVTDEEVKHELDHLLEKYTELSIKENGIVEDGNIAIIDFEGFKDGVAFDGGKGENYSLEIGSNTFIPGFEEQVKGMKLGEEKDLNLAFPKDYGVADLAGKDVVFKVKVNEIKEKVQRELDQDFFDDLGIEGVDSKDKLEDSIRKQIKEEKDYEVENKYVEQLLEAISKNVEVSIPEEMVNEEVDHLLERFEQHLKSQGISLDLYYQITKSKEEDLRNQLEKDAYSNVLYRLMLEEIMNQEKVEVSKEEAMDHAKELAKDYKMNEDEFLAQFGGIEMMQYDLEMHKVIDLLKELNK